MLASHLLTDNVQLIYFFVNRFAQQRQQILTSKGCVFSAVYICL